MLRKIFAPLMIVLFVCAVALTFSLSFFKYKALAYNPLDFPFYFQFNVKIFDARYTPRFSMNPEGTNVLGVGGIEGEYALQQNLHFELMKYVQGIVVYLTRWPEAQFVVLPVLYYMPILYLYSIFRNKSPREQWFALLLAALYVVWPSTIQATAFDARPFAYLTPILTCLLLALYYRTDAEIILFFNLLFVVREEALCFNAIFLAYYIYRVWPIRSQKKRTIMWLGISYLSWACCILLYYLYQPFPYFDDPFLRLYRLLPKIIVLSYVAMVASLGVLLVLRRQIHLIKNFVHLLFPIAIVLPFALKFGTGTSPLGFLELFLFTARPGILIVGLVGAAIALYTSIPRAQSVAYGTLLVGVIFGLVTLAATPYSALRATLNYYALSHTYDKLWYWHNRLNPLTHGVVTNLAAYQAFSDYENVVTFDRLPVYITRNRDSHRWSFPRNSSELGSLLPQMQYLILTNTTTHIVQEFEKRFPVRFTHIDSDEHVAVFSITTVTTTQ